MENPFGLGSNPSHYDYRTITHDLASPIASTGGVIYSAQEHEHQHKVGICTAISLVQNAEKVTGKKYSPDFNYLLQKKFYDLDWYEGSSIFNALRVGKTFGFLPLELFPYIIEQDRLLPYNQYISKLESISDIDIQRLIVQCVDKLTGYATVDVSNQQSVNKAINDSSAGILCRYDVTDAWWLPSWNSKDIDPIRPYGNYVGGHAIGATYYDNNMITHANTWGTTWDLQGNCNINYDNYKMTEAWIPYYNLIPTPKPKFDHIFNISMQYGQTSSEVMYLQQLLSIKGYFKIEPTGFYGNLTKQAVFKAQLDNLYLSWWEKFYLQGSKVGPKTLNLLNVWVKGL